MVAVTPLQLLRQILEIALACGVGVSDENLVKFDDLGIIPREFTFRGPVDWMPIGDWAGNLFIEHGYDYNFNQMYRGLLDKVWSPLSDDDRALIDDLNYDADGLQDQLLALNHYAFEDWEQLTEEEKQEYDNDFRNYFVASGAAAKRDALKVRFDAVMDQIGAIHEEHRKLQHIREKYDNCTDQAKNLGGQPVKSYNYVFDKRPWQARDALIDEPNVVRISNQKSDSGIDLIVVTDNKRDQWVYPLGVDTQGMDMKIDIELSWIPIQVTPSDTWFSSFALEWARDVEHWISPERVAPYKVEGGPEVYFFGPGGVFAKIPKSLVCYNRMNVNVTLGDVSHRNNTVDNTWYFTETDFGASIFTESSHGRPMILATTSDWINWPSMDRLFRI